MRESSDRSSNVRKQALRRLAREQRTAYQNYYDELWPHTENRFQARGQAWTRLRHQFPDRYLELYAIERAAPGANVPADVRSKAWQRATSILADVRKTAYRQHFERFRLEGHNRPRAYVLATAALRTDDPELFTELLAREITLWQALGETTPPIGVE